MKYPERGAAPHTGSSTKRKPGTDRNTEAIDDAKRQIRLEQEVAVRESADRSPCWPVDIAEKVIRGKLDSSPAQMTMIERMLDEMPSMKQ